MGGFPDSLLQDFEVAFCPRSVHVETRDVVSDHAPASPMYDLTRQKQRSAGLPPISQPACSFQRQVNLRLYVCDSSTSA